MARGGKRTGTPGTAYGNRTDLNAGPAQSMSPNPAPVYGQGQAQAAVTSSAPPPPSPAPHLGPKAGTLINPTAPTEAPGEPVTAGLPSGAGPGPEALSMAGQPSAELLALRAHLPYLARAAQDPNTPASVISFVKYLQGLTP